MCAQALVTHWHLAVVFGFRTSLPRRLLNTLNKAPIHQQWLKYVQDRLDPKQIPSLNMKFLSRRFAYRNLNDCLEFRT